MLTIYCDQCGDELGVCEAEPVGIVLCHDCHVLRGK